MISHLGSLTVAFTILPIRISAGTNIVAASVAQRSGYGGHAWVFLQDLPGFRQLRLDVLQDFRNNV